MPTYLYQLSYTPESLAAQIRKPQDRMVAAAQPAVAAIGGKLLGGGFAFGEFDAIFLFEAPDDESAVGLSAAIAAGGAVKTARTTKLLSGPQWVSALEKAGVVAAGYKPSK